jgi:hypothetical protein
MNCHTLNHTEIRSEASQIESLWRPMATKSMVELLVSGNIAEPRGFP